MSIFLWFCSVAILLLSLVLGPGRLTFSQVFSVLYAQLSGISTASTAETLVWQLRFPRSLLALLVGAALACGGVITQGVFRNPLASPNILGLSSGAALAVVLGISFGLDELSLGATPLLATAGALLSLFLLYLLSQGTGGILALLLCGIALSTLFSACLTLLLSIHLRDYQITMKISQWLLGSLEARSWFHFYWGLMPISLGLAIALYLRKDLDVLHLGTQSAHSLGVHLRRTYLLSVFCVALLVGTATALVGIIGFVGLVVPHLARLLVGASHRRLIPFTVCLGSGFMLLVDIVSRISVHVYLPPGAITSLVGAPFFLWLIRRHYQRRHLYP